MLQINNPISKAKGIDAPADTSIEEAILFTQQIKGNVTSLIEEWSDLKHLYEKDEACIKQDESEFLLVDKKLMNGLVSEVSQLKEVLPKILTKKFNQTYLKVDLLQNELNLSQAELEKTKLERDYWKSKCNAALADCEQEKKEKFGLRCDVQEISEQLTQQSEYCASMGSATCTLLWRVSRSDECIQSILVGTKVEEFLKMVGVTLGSYIATYQDDFPSADSEETQFILSLCGIMTNIAASPVGRNFLMTNETGTDLLDTLMHILSEAPSPQCARMKNLILMFLYNMCINQSGLKYISAKPGIIGLLAWILQDETEMENRLHSIRLIQSLVYEHDSPKILSEVNESLPMEFFQQLSDDKHVEVREAAVELMNDLQTMKSEQ